MAITSPGHLRAWGHNGQISKVNHKRTADTYVTVSVGDRHTVAITSTGHLRAWGNDSWVQVSKIDRDETYMAVSAGYTHTVAITSTGHLRVWGHNTYRRATDYPEEIWRIPTKLHTHVLIRQNPTWYQIGTQIIGRPKTGVGYKDEIENLLDSGDINMDMAAEMLGCKVMEVRELLGV